MKERLGSNGDWKEVLNHPFFKNFYEDVMKAKTLFEKKKFPALFKPDLKENPLENLFDTPDNIKRLRKLGTKQFKEP